MKFGLFQSVQLPEPGAQVQYYQKHCNRCAGRSSLAFTPYGLPNTTSRAMVSCRHR